MDQLPYSSLTKVGFGVLACNSALAVCNSWGDAASVAFVGVSYAALLLLFLSLRAYESAPPGSPAKEWARLVVWLLTAMLPSPQAGDDRCRMERQFALAMAAFAVLACNSVLSIHKARRGDEGSLVLVLVLAAYAALVASISLFLAKFDDRANGVQRQRGRGMAAADNAAHGHVRLQDGGAAHSRRTAGQRQAALAMIAFAILACDSALSLHKARGDVGSVAFVLVAFAALIGSISFFLTKFNDRADEVLRENQRPRGGRAMGVTAMFASRVAPLMPPAVAVVVWMMAVATAGGGFWAFFLN